MSAYWDDLIVIRIATHLQNDLGKLTITLFFDGPIYRYFISVSGDGNRLSIKCSNYRARATIARISSPSRIVVRRIRIIPDEIRSSLTVFEDELDNEERVLIVDVVEIK